MRVPRVVRSLMCKLTGRPDRARWSDVAQLLPSWDERTHMIAGMIPKGSNVIEFGAGRRMLEQFLPGSCRYVPSDLVDRGPGTLVCDLNREPRPDLEPLHIDTAVFGGVLEYIQDLPSLIGWITQYVDLCIVSYECAQTRSSDLQRLQESLKRARAGWVNTFHEEELLELFRRHGFRLRERLVWETEDGPEPIFAFQREL